MNLKDKVAGLPLTPGVYLMKDSLGQVIYVGKAKQLKRRVQSYFYQSKGHSPKVKQLVSHIRDLDVILTDTEFEAFMLECRLIKEIKPMYNRKMKNPLAYTYIAVHQEKTRRQMAVSYDSETPAAVRQFGPYTSRGTVERAIQGIKESQRILCGSPNNRGSYCLNHSLGLCMGMCGDPAVLPKYEAVIDKTIALLDGTDTEILDELERRMSGAAERFDFEGAAKYRDYVTAVRALLQKEQVIGFAEASRNIAVLERMEGEVFKLILIKGGKLRYQGKLETTGMELREIHQRVLETISGHFTPSAASGPSKVTRHEIDEAQIIYSYLKDRPQQHLIILEEHLTPGQSVLLSTAVRSWLEPILADGQEEPD
ncbi:UvrB/UvrC motif-containing protein [Paenibacillus tengchongensis]|uniref:UvrB/UvrC motif-containing protein n=1 Tax=Paenibacillus tengchongensis TaxID=2608684 RepID=UPI00124E2FA7|nr:UvrB/UvrC motif-containing protein [Paenibacillus tengchongensis]